MATLASAHWWVRADGNSSNGGGYDSTISGAGTNYCDQAAAQLSLTDLTTTGAGSTTLGSATGGFTSAMIGSAIQIPTGTNFQAGFYWVYGYTNTNTVTLDRTPTSGGAGSGGSGKLGGAFASVSNLRDSGSWGSAPNIATPLAAGHTVHVRGSGADNPSSADWTSTGQVGFPSGNYTAGLIRWIGYNGRPFIVGNGTLWFNGVGHYFENMKFGATGSALDTHILQGNDQWLRNVYFDLTTDVGACKVPRFVENCWFFNTGSTSGVSGAFDVLRTSSRELYVTGCLFENCRGPIISAGLSFVFEGNIVVNCRNTTTAVSLTDSQGWNVGQAVRNNIFYNCVGSGISSANLGVDIKNNIFVNNGVRGVAITANSGSATINDRVMGDFLDYNAYYNNSSGEKSGITGGSHEITLTGDPFINAAAKDFRLNNVAGAGAALRAAGFPATFPGGYGNVSYFDIGAVQHQSSVTPAEVAEAMWNYDNRELT